uniref:Evasin n=1 Tax=Amblyomma cajennense TaxID=34607 RepID=A0A023FE70_AMBCJ
MKLHDYHNLIVLLCGLQLLDAFIAESTIDIFGDPDAALEYIYESTKDSSEEFVFNDTQDICTIPALNTSNGPLPVGCYMACITEGNTSLPDGSKCINMTVEEATAMRHYYSKACQLGSCISGHCANCGDQTCCTRLPIMTMSISNENNDKIAQAA